MRIQSYRWFLITLIWTVVNKIIHINLKFTFATTLTPLLSTLHLDTIRPFIHLDTSKQAGRIVSLQERIYATTYNNIGTSRSSQLVK